MFQHGRADLQVLRPAAGELRFGVLRQGHRRAARSVGLSMFAGYSYNERSMLSLGIVDPDIADRRRTDAGLGRRERRHQEDHRRAPQADRDPRHGVAGAVFPRRARNLRRRLAHAPACLSIGRSAIVEELPSRRPSTVRAPIAGRPGPLRVRLRLSWRPGLPAVLRVFAAAAAPADDSNRWSPTTSPYSRAQDPVRAAARGDTEAARRWPDNSPGRRGRAKNRAAGFPHAARCAPRRRPKETMH